jgi:hypothetical protein
MKDQHYAAVNELDNITVSYSHNTRNPYLTQTTLGKILDRIKNDTELYEIIDSIRSHSDKEERRKLKEENLPYFVLGTFKNNHRKSDNLISTQFISIDFDDLNGNAYDLDKKLRADENVFTFFKSPSNNRKVIYKLDRAINDRTEYSRVYSYFLNEINNKYGFEADKQTSDAARAIFLSYDPDLYINNNSKPLCIDEVPEPKSTAISFKGISDEYLKHIPTVAAFLTSVNLSYDEWVKCGLALTQLGEKGRAYFVYLSLNKFHKDTPDELNAKYDQLLETTEGKITLATLFQIAKEYGFSYSEIRKEEPVKTQDRLDYASELRERFEIDDNRDPNKPLGFPLTKFKALSEHTDGIQPGFYHLAAESNIGKTAVFTNLALDLLDTNPDLSVMYFSLDDSRRYTAYRFLSILSQLHINKIQKPQIDPNNFNKIVDARDKFLDLVDTGRLIVKDLGDITHIDHLQSIITGVNDLSKLVVFVDGLYNLEVTADGNQGVRIENIERAQRVKQIVDKFKIPFLSTGELRKKMKNEGKKTKPTLHDLMETGKYAYNANVVWLLSSHIVDPLTNMDTLALDFAKNKLSDFKGEQYLLFDRPTGTIRESNIVSMSSMLNDYDEDFDLGGEIE